MQLFFTSTCKGLFMDETVNFVLSGAAYRASPVITVYSRAGAKVGDARHQRDRQRAPTGGIKVTAVGTLQPKNGGSTLRLALSCQIPLVNQSVQPARDAGSARARARRGGCPAP